jgi:hypothetical protein
MFINLLFYLDNIQEVLVSEKVLKIFLRGLSIDNRHILPAIGKEMDSFFTKCKNTESKIHMGCLVSGSFNHQAKTVRKL